MAKLVNRSKVFLKKNSSTILTCVGGVGVVATAVLAVKATPKAVLMLEEAKTEKGEELTKLEVVKVAGPSYIPAVAVGVGTLICIFGANALSKRQQAGLVSAYALLDGSYKNYKKKVEDIYGANANEAIQEELAKDTYEEEKENLPEVVENENVLFFDAFSGRYFESTMDKVLQAEYTLNRELVMRDYVALNEFYEFLDIPAIESGLQLGWSNGANFANYWQTWVDFNHKKVLIDDDLECYIIEMFQEPVIDYVDYW